MKKWKIVIKSKWWKPGNGRYLRPLHPYFLSACPRHLTFLHHALSLLPWFWNWSLSLSRGITILALVSWMCLSFRHLTNGIFQYHPTCVFQHNPSVKCFSTLIRYPTRSLDDAIFLTSRCDAHKLTLWLTHTHLNIWFTETCLTLFLCVLSMMISLLSVLPLWSFLMMHS